MTTFQELDAYLNQEFSDDYWYDDAKFYACELVKQLTTDDWNALKSLGGCTSGSSTTAGNDSSGR